MATATSKNNMTFKMSKKVAELTQVVHMLFTRNHEKEVELETVIEAYEQEISVVIADARQRLSDLQARMDELELYKNQQEQQKEIKQKEDYQRLENELNAQTAHLTAQLEEEKHESRNLRDLLIQAQRDLEDIRRIQTDESARAKRTADAKEKEIARLKSEIVMLNKDIQSKDSILDSKGELLRTHERLRKDLEQLQVSLQSTEKAREESLARCRQLEVEVKMVKKELARRMAERHTDKSISPSTNSNQNEYNEEVEQLRRELLRYKMELSNRENNFNRVFSDIQPITTEPQHRRFARSGAVHDGIAHGGRLLREKTYAGESLKMPADIDTERVSLSATGRPVVRTSGRPPEKLLPQLLENTFQRLARPKPLPKELLSQKASTR